MTLTALLAGPALSVTLPSVDTPLETGSRAPADAAVVIGLEDYPFLSDVPYARRDAQAVHDFLVHTRGIPEDRVRLLTSGGRERMLEALEEAMGEVRAGGTLWVYFAGHGAAARSDGRRLLLGDDVRQDVRSFEERGVALDEIEGLERRAGARLLLLVDAGHDGLGRGGGELVPARRLPVPTWLSAPEPDVGHWTAASAGQVAGPLHPVQHGAFTYFALGALRGWGDGALDGVRDGRVTAEEAQRYVDHALRQVGILDQNPVLSLPNPSGWVLASGAPEEPPDLDGGLTGPVFAIAGGGLDAGDDELVTEVLQTIVDRCAARSVANVPGEQWYVRFRVDRGRVRGFWAADPAEEAEPEADAERLGSARATCIRREIEGLAFARGDGRLIARTLRVGTE